MRNINIGGASRPVEYTMQSAKRFQEITGGKNILALDNVSFREPETVIAFFFVGLECGYRIEKQVVGDWIKLNDMVLLNEFVNVLRGDSLAGANDVTLDDKKK
jgi:hypothetical protein